MTELLSDWSWPVGGEHGGVLGEGDRVCGVQSISSLNECCGVCGESDESSAWVGVTGSSVLAEE